MIVKKLRLRRGWSQEQLSDFSGLSVRTIQRIEKGQTAGVESLKSLAAVFEVSITDLQQEPSMDQTTNSLNNDINVTLEERQAFEYVRKLKGFYSHLATYCVVIPALFMINIMTNPDYIWAWWPMLGWGIGICSHGLKLISPFQILTPEWEKRQIEKRLGRKL